MGKIIKKAIFNWSGGKDSALALYHALKDPSIKVVSLFTTLNGSGKLISMHGVPDTLLNRQCAGIGLPLKKLYLPERPLMDEYNEAMAKAFLDFEQQGITQSIYGDIFLEDLREYREEQLKEVGMTAIFPLWKRDAKEVMQEFLNLGFKTIVVSVNASLLDKSFCGRVIDQQFMEEIPEGVDPCGENGEFHTFVFDGPIYKEPVDFRAGDKVFRTYPSPVEGEGKIGFWFQELIK